MRASGDMRGMWDYLKQLGWTLRLGLVGMAGGVACLVIGFVMTRNELEQEILRAYGRYSDKVGMVLIFGLALFFVGSAASILSWWSGR